MDNPADTSAHPATPELYRNLLEQEIATLSITEADEILRLYEAKSGWLRVMEPKDHPEMLNQADRLCRLLREPGRLNERETLVALAALRYFVRDEDHAHDCDSGGHSDDALVIQAAVEELGAR